MHATATTILIRQQVRKIGPLGLIILLHLGFFYALQSGLLKQAAQALPTREVFASFITPERPPAPSPPKPKAAPPKTVSSGVEYPQPPQPKYPQQELHLRAERTTQYEEVAQVMTAAQSGGLGKIGFVTEPQAK